LQICDDLKVNNNTDKYLSLIQRNKKAQGSIKCFMYSLEDFPALIADRNNPAAYMDDFLKLLVPEVNDEETSKKIPVSQAFNTAGGARIGWDGKNLKFVAISIEAKEILQYVSGIDNVKSDHIHNS